MSCNKSLKSLTFNVCYSMSKQDLISYYKVLEASDVDVSKLNTQCPRYPFSLSHKLFHI